MKYQYVEDFKKLGFGMFVHFGLYSVLGRAEWAKKVLDIPYEEYDKLIPKFNPRKDWAKKIVKVAKNAGCKYITLTTRHHDGFSLYDTKGVSDYDINLTKHKRDLVREFVDACNEQGIIPFFYHTLLDWHHPDFDNNFPSYIDYLVNSVEILCRNYGKIGGIWFDGMCSKWEEDWQEDRLYGTIRKYQPTAMIINNTGLKIKGKLGHKEIDCATFERGDTEIVSSNIRPIASEACDVLNESWGYCYNDIKYKPIKEVLLKYMDARANGANFLLNVGPMGNGELRKFDEGYFELIGIFNKRNNYVINSFKKCDITAENALIYKGDGDDYYAVMGNVGCSGPDDVVDIFESQIVTINADIKDVELVGGQNFTDIRKNNLSGGDKIECVNNTFTVPLVAYGDNYPLRIAKFKLK